MASGILRKVNSQRYNLYDEREDHVGWVQGFPRHPEHSVERLPNSYYRVEHRPSQLVYLYHNEDEMKKDVLSGVPGNVGAGSAALSHIQGKETAHWYGTHRTTGHMTGTHLDRHAAARELLEHHGRTRADLGMEV